MKEDCTSHKKMRPREILFCENYARHFNGARAAREAGHPASASSLQAYLYLSRPYIREYIEIKMKEAIEKAGVTRVWRLEMLKKGVEICLQQQKKFGKPVYPFLDLRALRSLIGEINKMAGDHAAVTSNVNVYENNLDDTVQIAEKAEKELIELKPY